MANHVNGLDEIDAQYDATRAEFVAPDTCHKLHAQIAELERDNANQAKLLEVLRETIAELERERDAANKRAKEYVGVFKRVNAAKRVWRKRAEQAEAKLVEAQSRLIAGAVYEKLDSVKYWKARAEQAEAELGAAINQRNIAQRFVNENADLIEYWRDLFKRANAEKRAYRADYADTEIRKRAEQAEADARALATAATTSKMLRSNYENELIAKYLEAKNEQ